MIALILFILLLIQTPTKPIVITCTVIAAGEIVACDSETKGRRQMWLIKRFESSALDEWRWTAPLQDGGVNPDAPLYRTGMVKGQKVKAMIVDGELKPVASCQVRVWRNMNKHRKPGEIPSFSLRTEPDDCQPWYGKG